MHLCGRQDRGVSLHQSAQSSVKPLLCAKLGFEPACFVFVLARSIWHLLTIDLQRKMLEAIHRHLERPANWSCICSIVVSIC
jgi:hypothetical protein